MNAVRIGTINSRPPANTSAVGASLQSGFAGRLGGAGGRVYPPCQRGGYWTWYRDDPGAPLTAQTLLILSRYGAGRGALLLGLRGKRLDRHPVCRDCRFDLSGQPEGVMTCRSAARG